MADARAVTGTYAIHSSNVLPHGIDRTFLAAVERLHLAGPDALARLLADLQRQYPAASGGIAAAVQAVAAHDLAFVRAASRIVDRRDVLRDVLA